MADQEQTCCVKKKKNQASIFHERTRNYLHLKHLESRKIRLDKVVKKIFKF